MLYEAETWRMNIKHSKRWIISTEWIGIWQGTKKSQIIKKRHIMEVDETVVELKEQKSVKKKKCGMFISEEWNVESPKQ